MCVHTVLADHSLHDEMLAAVQKRVSADFKIAHANVQVECKGCSAYETHLRVVVWRDEATTQPIIFLNPAGLCNRSGNMEPPVLKRYHTSAGVAVRRGGYTLCVS